MGVRGLKFTKCPLWCHQFTETLSHLFTTKQYLWLDISIFQLRKPRHEEVIWFAQSHIALMPESSTQASKSRSPNPCFSELHESWAASNLNYILGETIQIFWGFPKKKEGSGKIELTLGKPPKAFEDGDPMHSFIQKDCMSGDKKEVKIKNTRLKIPVLKLLTIFRHSPMSKQLW